MKNNIRTFLIFIVSILIVNQLNFAQGNKVRASLAASVSQTLGVNTKITVDYSRPGVKNRKIFGELVPFGMNEGNKYSDNKPYPWRGGANECTKFETTSDLLVEGQTLPAGKYSIHIIPQKEEWTIIFNKNTDLWGSFKYNESDDALRVKVKVIEAPFKEWLEYGFDNLNGTEAGFFLHWDKVKVEMKISIK